MKFKLFALVILILIGIQSTLFSQTKVGYTNVELIMAYMPQVKEVDQKLGTYRKQLSKKIRIKQEYYQVKLSEYSQKAQANGFASQNQQKEEEASLIKIQEEIQKLSTESELQLAQRQQELLNPIMTLIQDKINEVAKEGNYTYILNQTTGMNLLYGLETMNVTDELAAKLGITIPKN